MVILIDDSSNFTSSAFPLRGMQPSIPVFAISNQDGERLMSMLSSEDSKNIKLLANFFFVNLSPILTVTTSYITIPNPNLNTVCFKKFDINSQKEMMIGLYWIIGMFQIKLSLYHSSRTLASIIAILIIDYYLIQESPPKHARIVRRWAL
jgi:hypothetical protein